MWLFGITCTRRMSSEVAHDMESRLSTIPSWYFYKTFDWFNFWLTRFKSGFRQANILTLSRLLLMHNLSCKFWSLIFIFILLFVCSVKGNSRDPKFQNRMGQKCQQSGRKGLIYILICFTVKSDLSNLFFVHT